MTSCQLVKAAADKAKRAARRSSRQQRASVKAAGLVALEAAGGGVDTGKASFRSGCLPASEKLIMCKSNLLSNKDNDALASRTR